MPRRPYCSDELSWGIYPRRFNLAVRRKYIQLNPPRTCMWMIFDVDRHVAHQRWSDVNLPPPAWTASDRRTGRGHVVYGLAYPVKTDVVTPQTRLLAAVQHAVTDRLDADRGYSGLMTKNPRWQDQNTGEKWSSVAWAKPGTNYTLREFLDWVDLPKKTEKPSAAEIRIGLGRNIEIFDLLRFWAYKAWPDHSNEELWIRAVCGQADRISMSSLHIPFLSCNEVGHIAKSVARWVWKHRGEFKTSFSALQSARGKLGGRPEVEKPWLEYGLSRSGYLGKLKAGTLRPLIYDNTQIERTSHE